MDPLWPKIIFHMESTLIVNQQVVFYVISLHCAYRHSKGILFGLVVCGKSAPASAVLFVRNLRHLVSLQTQGHPWSDPVGVLSRETMQIETGGLTEFSIIFNHDWHRLSILRAQEMGI